MSDKRPRVSARCRAEYQRCNFVASGQVIPDRPHGVPMLDDDIRLHSRLVENFSDRRADHPLDPQALLFLDRGLHAAELNEILRLDDPKDLDSSARLRRSPRGETERHARFRAVVDDDEVDAFLIVPHLAGTVLR